MECPGIGSTTKTSMTPRRIHTGHQGMSKMKVLPGTVN